MMLLSVVLLIVSFLIQGLMSNFLGVTYFEISIFSTVYVLISLLLIYTYFENKKKYILLLFIFGWLVDLVYTNTLFLNVSLFFLVYNFSRVFHFFFPYNFLTVNISNILGIFIYHILTFLILIVLGVDNYSFMMIFKMLGCNILMTVIYTSISYFVINFLKQRLELKEVK